MTRLSRSQLLLPVLLLLLAACGDPMGVGNPNVELRTDRESYAPGDEGTVTLTNNGKYEIPYLANMCDLATEHLGPEGWEPLVPDFDPICSLVGTNLPPGRSFSRAFPVPVPPYEPGGIYRFRVSVSDGWNGPRVIKYSNTFTVTEPEDTEG